MRAGREGAWERAILTRPLINPCQEKEAADTAPALVDADLLMTTQLTVMECSKKSWRQLKLTSAIEVTVFNCTLAQP